MPNDYRITTTILLLCAVACAGTPKVAREPARLPAPSEAAGATDDVFTHGEAITAILLGPPDARGERLPICQVALRDRPELAPSFVSTATTREELRLSIRACRAGELNQITRVAADANRPQLARVGRLIEPITICTVNFAIAASIMAGYHFAQSRVGPESTLVNENRIRESTVIAASGIEAWRNRPNHGPRALVAGVCSLVGANAANGVAYFFRFKPN